MNSNERKLRLEQIKNGNPLFNKPLWYKGVKESFGVYEVPLDLLVYNKHNGRIMSRVLSFEKTNRKLSSESEFDKIIIEKFLWESAPQNNIHTLESLKRYGQNEVGIITNDGIIIDGNRRASLLSILNKDDPSLQRRFLTIILPDNLSNEPKKISELETIYQIGVDDKVDYNPIEKYLKVKELSVHFSEEHIAKLMSVNVPKIQEFFGVLSLMEEYLSFFDYSDFYLVLDKREGHFVDLYKYLNKYKEYIRTPSKNCNWNYSECDLDELKKVYFTYIRLGLPVQTCRMIGRTKKFGSFFTILEIWKPFKETVLAKLEETADKSISTLLNAHPDADLFDSLRKKEEEWKISIEVHLRPLLENSGYSLTSSRQELDLNNKVSYFQNQFEIFYNYPDEELKAFKSEFDLIQRIVNRIVEKINK